MNWGIERYQRDIDEYGWRTNGWLHRLVHAVSTPDDFEWPDKMKATADPKVTLSALPMDMAMNYTYVLSAKVIVPGRWPYFFFGRMRCTRRFIKRFEFLKVAKAVSITHEVPAPDRFKVVQTMIQDSMIPFDRALIKRHAVCPIEWRKFRWEPLPGFPLGVWADFGQVTVRMDPPYDKPTVHEWEPMS